MTRIARIAGLAAAMCLLSLPAAGEQAAKPITKDGLVQALKIGGLGADEIANFVHQRGVDFRMTEEVEREIRAAGGSSALIEAVRNNYRGTEAPPAPREAPRTEPSPPAPQPAPAAPAVEKPAAPAAAPKPAEPAPAPNVKTLREIRRIYIDPMPNGLDHYIRAEISKELKNRMQVVLAKDEADAIMTGVSEQKTGTGAAITGRYLGLHDTATGAVTITDKSGRYAIWSSEAGDRSLLFGPLKKGGPSKVADRLVKKLKEAIQNE